MVAADPTPTLRPAQGPKGAWLTGHLSHFSRDPLAFLEQCSREHGDFVPVRFLRKQAIVINDHHAIEEVLLTQSRHFTKMTGYQTPFVGRVFGNGLLTSEGSFWTRQRKMAQPAFHRQRVSAYAPVIVDFAEELLRGWKSGETRSIHADLTHLGARVIMKALFGTPVPPAIEEFDRLSLEAMQEMSRQRSMLGLLRAMLPSEFGRRFNAMMDGLDAFIHGQIEAHRARGGDAGDILSMLLDARDDQGQGMTNQQLRDELMTFIAAGLDTTVLAMTWSCYLLAKHPAVAARLREELRTVLGGRPPTLADLGALKFTDGVLKESMRLFPPAWIVTRDAAVDCTVGGYPVRKGTAVIMSQWLKHRDARVFPRPHEFDPTRWIDSPALPKFAYFPFGGGPRLCIGSGLAMIEAPLGLAAICQRFRFECDPDYEVKPWASIALHPRGGLRLRVHAV